MYRNKYIKYKSKYLDLQSFINTHNGIVNNGLPNNIQKDPSDIEEEEEEDGDDVKYPIEYEDEDAVEKLQSGPPHSGGGRTKTNSVCKLCNNKCNSVICNKCLKTEKGNVFIEQLYGGDLSETSDSESE